MINRSPLVIAALLALTAPVAAAPIEFSATWTGNGGCGAECIYRGFFTVANQSEQTLTSFSVLATRSRCFEGDPARWDSTSSGAASVGISGFGYGLVAMCGALNLRLHPFGALDFVAAPIYDLFVFAGLDIAPGNSSSDFFFNSSGVRPDDMTLYSTTFAETPALILADNRDDVAPIPEPASLLLLSAALLLVACGTAARSAATVASRSQSRSVSAVCSAYSDDMRAQYDAFAKERKRLINAALGDTLVTVDRKYL